MNDIYYYICLFGNKIQRRKSYYFFITNVKHFYLYNTIDQNTLKLNYKIHTEINYCKTPHNILSTYIHVGMDVSIYDYATLDIKCVNWIKDHGLFMKALCDHYDFNQMKEKFHFDNDVNDRIEQYKHLVAKDTLYPDYSNVNRNKFLYIIFSIED